MISKKDSLTKKEIIKKLIWGTHICYFYQQKQELIDFIIPYFQVGIQNNEYCMWIISDNLNVQEAENYLRKKVKNFDDINKKGQIKIIPYNNWYLQNNEINIESIIQSWQEHLNQAFSQGFNGMRVSGDISWLNKPELERFIDYEIEINRIIRDYNIMAVCTYPIEKFTKLEILEIANSHQFVLMNEKGKYKIIENAERRHINEEKKELHSYLQKLQKMETLGVLSGSIAHDFKNLLNLIIGNVDIALMKIDEKNPSYKYLNEISKYSTNASNLTKRMLNFSFSEKKVKQLINLNGIIENLLDFFKYLMIENILIKIDSQPDLWTIYMDQIEIEQIVLNLIINAKEAMPNGGKITIKTENVKIDKSHLKSHPGVEIGDYVGLTIEDTGVGIDKTNISRIFEPFFTTKEPGKGTGIGLPLVKFYITENKGYINVKSEVNKGTIFKIFLPAQKKA